MIRKTPDCPPFEPDDNIPLVRRVRPRPYCDPPAAIPLPEFTAPNEGTVLDPDLRSPENYLLGNAEVTLTCEDYPNYLLNPLQAVPTGSPVTVAASVITRTFFWTVSGLTTLELDNLYRHQLLNDLSIPLAAGDAAYFVALGVSPDSAQALVDLWDDVQQDLDEQAEARALASLQCLWLSPELTFVCPPATELTTLLTPSFTVPAGAFTSSVSEQNAIDQAQAQLDAIAVCRYTNVEVTYNCTGGSVGGSVVIPAGTIFGSTPLEVEEALAERGNVTLFCLFCNDEVEYTCVEHTGDAEGLSDSNLDVTIPAGTFCASTQEDADAAALAAAIAQIVCVFEAEEEVCCCCFPEGLTLDPDAPRDNNCKVNAVEWEGMAEGEGCPVLGEGDSCLFKYSTTPPPEGPPEEDPPPEDACDRTLGETPPCYTSTATSLISYADALEIARATAIATLLCDHANVEVRAGVGEELGCPFGQTSDATVVIPAGSLTAPNMTEANTLARIYAIALLQCKDDPAAVSLLLNGFQLCPCQLIPDPENPLQFEVRDCGVKDGINGAVFNVGGRSGPFIGQQKVYAQTLINAGGIVAFAVVASPVPLDGVVFEGGVQTQTNFFIGYTTVVPGGVDEEDEPLPDSLKLHQMHCGGIEVGHGFYNAKIVRVACPGNADTMLNLD